MIPLGLKIKVVLKGILVIQQNLSGVFWGSHLWTVTLHSVSVELSFLKYSKSEWKFFLLTQ